MDVFKLNKRMIENYSNYVMSFVSIRDEIIKKHVEREINDGVIETFPIIKSKDIQKYGRYRTKDAILRYYDNMKIE